MDTVWFLLQCAALFGLCVSAGLLALRLVTVSGGAADAWEVFQFLKAQDFATPKRILSGQHPAWVAHPPDWLRTPGWFVSWMERSMEETGPIGGLNASRMATIYAANFASFALALGLLAPVFLALAILFAGPEKGIRWGVVVVGVLGAAGLFQIRDVHKSLVKLARGALDELRLQLPYATDFMTLVLDAGGSIEDALQSYVEEAPESRLRDELRVVLQELRTGATKEEAFGRLGRRCPAHEIDRLALTVTQAGKMGTPLVEVFRQQAEILRLERIQRASEVADRMAINSTFPLSGVVFALVVVIVAPFFLEAIPLFRDIFR